jgi:hypothetical protein
MYEAGMAGQLGASAPDVYQFDHAISGSPFVVRALTPQAGRYGDKDELHFVLKFNEKVEVNPKGSPPVIPVEVNYGMEHAVYNSGSGSRKLAFQWSPSKGDLDLNGIILGRVDPVTGQRDFDFGGQITDQDGNSARDDIPSTNTANIQVDARGPIVKSFTNPTIQNGRAIVKVRFDRTVTVKGVPTIPIDVNGKSRLLRYWSGRNTNELTFGTKIPDGLQVGDLRFDPIEGEVILLSHDSNIRDSKGSEIQVVGADMGEDLVVRDSKTVLLGTHYQFLKTVSKEELNSWMDAGSNYYYSGATINPLLPPSPENLIPYLKDYQLPNHPEAAYDVDIYRVAYRSKIPSGGRYTTGYGIAAIPKTQEKSIPVISWEHQTVFNRRSAVSQAVSYPEASLDSLSLYSSRLKIAYHAGQGFAVFSADQYGLGNSTERYSYLTKAANQQVSLDNLRASLGLLEANKKSISKLFVSGFSSGGVTAMSFAEKLEQIGINPDGVAITGGPLNLEMNINAAIWNPRDGSDGNTPEATWLNYILVLSAFALEAYSGEEQVAEDILGKYYEAGRRIYSSEFSEIVPSADREGIFVDGLYLPNNPSHILPAKYIANPMLFAKSRYVQLLRRASSGQFPLAADLLMVYGMQDEVVANSVTQSLYDWPVINYGKKNINLNFVPSANHRGAFISMLYQALPWFAGRHASP